jgi:ribosomal protein S27AE
MEKTCPQCGSAKIIPKLPLTDNVGNSVQFEIVGNPKALIFQDAKHGTVNGWICGECGYTELWTSHFRELYEKYEKSIKDVT